MQTDARIKAFVLLASIIGIKIISGGIGKNELSIKEMNAKNQDAYFFDDCSNVQLYKNRKTFIVILVGKRNLREHQLKREVLREELREVLNH